jgi:hypothetical protein
MVSLTAAVIAWAPSGVLCTPSPPVDARRRENKDSASTLLLNCSQGRRHGGEPPECDRRTGFKGVVAIQEKYNPA